MSQQEVFNDKLNRDRYFELLTIAINEIITRGNTNNTGTVTLTENATTTTVKNSNFGANQMPIFEPLTANAAAEKAAGTMYVSARKQGEFTITHANNAQTDREFFYIHVG